jgi:hypothetical protein
MFGRNGCPRHREAAVEKAEAKYQKERKKLPKCGPKPQK